MKKFIQKTLAIILIVFLVVGMFPATVFAYANTPKNVLDMDKDEILSELKAVADDKDQEDRYKELKEGLHQHKAGDSSSSAYSLYSSRYSESMIWNEYLEVAVSETGKFTIGNVEGNPNYTSDNNQILLYGHPNPWSSETLITVDGSQQYFVAESINVDNDNGIITANMTIDDVVIMQILTFIENPATGRKDNVKISYSVINGSSTSKNIGIRIMMDTMLANNDYAPFKVEGYGNVTSAKVLNGSQITQTYQVYDDLDNPTTMANGILWLDGDRRPDKVQYSNWGNISGSGWDHYVSDGDYLGDSSVAIYFNPIAVPANSATKVNTYYGTGIGLSSRQISNNVTDISLTTKQFAVYVFDSKTNSGVKNVDVKLDGIGTVTTNNNGVAIFDNISNYNNQSVAYTATHSDYLQSKGNVLISGGSAHAVYIKNANDTAPLILSAKMTSSKAEYNDKDLLASNVYFNSNAENTPSDRNNSYPVYITVTSEMTDCAYQLISDNHVIKESRDGKFELTALASNGRGKTFSRHRIKELSAGKKVYVKAIASDGTSSQLKLLGIKVSEPSSYATNLVNDFSFTPKISLGDLGGASEICRILFGTKELDIKEDKKLPLEISIDEDGKVRAAYNLFEKDWESTEENYQKIIANRTSAAKAFGAKANSFGMGKAKVDFSVAGYGEGYFSDGGITISLGVYATLSGKAEYTHTFFLGVVPVYIKVGASAELSAQFGATIVNDGNFTFKITTGVFEPTFSLYAEAGAGISGVLSAGVQGKGSLTYKNDFLENYQSVKLTASASIELHAFLYSDSIRIAQKTWTLYDSNSRSRMIMFNNAMTANEEYTADSFSLAPRNYLRTRSGNANDLNSGVYTDPRPVMVDANGIKCRFWIDDDINRIDVNRTAIKYSFYNEEYEEWEEPQILDDDGTADFAFDVIAVGPYFYVAYQEANKVYSDEDAETILASGATGLETMAKDSVITLKRVSSTNVTDYGVISDSSVISGVKMGSMIPKLSVNGSELTVVWTSNSENDILAEKDESQNYIWYTKATIDSSTAVGVFDTAKYVSIGTPPVTTIDVGSINGVTSLAYTVDTDNDFNSLGDRELYYINGLHNNLLDMVKLSNNDEVVSDYNPIFTKIANENILIWFENGNYYYFSKSSDEITKVFDEDSYSEGTNNGYAVLQGQNADAIVWCATSSDATDEYATYSLYATKLVNGNWQTPYEVGKLSEIDTPSILSLSGYLDEDDKCNVSYSVLKYDNETFELSTSSLCYFDEYESSEFKTLYVDYDIMEAYSGNTISFVAAVKNTGTLPLTELSLEVNDISVDNDLSADPLMPGVTKEITFDLKIPENWGPYNYDIYFYGSTEDIEDFSDSTEESFYIEANRTDVSVSQGDTIVFGNAEYCTFVIENKSNLVVNDINFKILLDENEVGAVVYDENIHEIAAQEKITLKVKKELLGSSTVAFGRLSAEDEDFNLANNRVMICNNVEIPDTTIFSKLTVKSSDSAMGNVTVDSGFASNENGSFVKSVKTNDIAELTATPVSNEYAFVCWELDGNGMIVDKYAPTTTYYMGDGNSTVTAKFACYQPITKITIPETLSIRFGDEYAFTPVLSPVDTTDHIIWTSDDMDIVSVDEDGYITTNAVGTTTITATSSYNSEVFAKTTVTVEEIKITDLYMVYPNYVLDGVGSEEKLSVIPTPINATEGIVFESNNPSVVSVSETGIITSNSAGNATITAKSKSGGVLVTTDVTVTRPIERIYFEETTTEMEPGETKTVLFAVDPLDATESIDSENIVWTSSNPSIVSVESFSDRRSATITAQNMGTSTITVMVNGIYAAVMNVTSTIEVESIDIDPAEITIVEGESQDIEYTVTPYAASELAYWSSTNADVAYVSNGTLYAVNSGEATITLQSDNGIADSLRVLVTRDEVIVTGIEDLQSEHNYSDNTNKWWLYTVKDAIQISLTFSEDTCFESGYDNLYVYNKEGERLYTYTGNDLASQTITVDSDTVQLNLRTDGSANYYGFKVTSASAIVDISKSATIAEITSWKCSSTEGVYPVISVTYDGKSLVNGTDYTISIVANEAIIVGKGQFTGTKVIPAQQPENVHIYTDACDKACNICGATRTVGAHKYSNSCDATCNYCGAKRTIKHTYSNNCDTSCNVCKTSRTITHTYSNNCDKSCDICGTTRTVGAHKYSNNCDTTCNYCSAKRTIKHTYTNACDTACNVCKAKRTIKHTYSNNCDTSCNVCKATRTITHSYKTTTTKATLSKNGSVVKKCTVCGKVASNTAIKYVKSFRLSTTTYTYDGKVKTPSVTVKDSAGKTLKKNIDYTVTYASGRKNAGTYKVTVKMIGKYSGTKTLTFKINPAKISSYKLSATTYTYDGKVKSPSVTVKNASGVNLTKNTHYTVTYVSGRKNVGTYKVTVKGKGNYTGTKTLTFKINPPKTTVSKLTAGKKSITVAITKKSTQVTGYQIQYSTSKSFSKATTKTISSYKTTKYTLKSLSAKKTYYVRVRTYKIVGKTKYYSGWSTYKYVKTK